MPSVGYDGTIDEGQWAALADNLGSPYQSNLTVSVVSGVDRTVQISAGYAYGHGIRDTFASATTLQLATIASGTRWDCIAVRRDWGANSSTLVAIAGNSTQQIPAGRNANPGTLDDQPIALVQLTAGQQAPTAVVNLTAQSSQVVSTASAMGILAPILGQVAIINGTAQKYTASGWVDIVAAAQANNISMGVRTPAWTQGSGATAIAIGNGSISSWWMKDATSKSVIELMLVSRGSTTNTGSAAYEFSLGFTSDLTAPFDGGGVFSSGINAVGYQAVRQASTRFQLTSGNGTLLSSSSPGGLSSTTFWWCWVAYKTV